VYPPHFPEVADVGIMQADLIAALLSSSPRLPAKTKRELTKERLECLRRCEEDFCICFGENHRIVMEIREDLNVNF